MAPSPLHTCISRIHPEVWPWRQSVPSLETRMLQQSPLDAGGTGPGPWPGHLPMHRTHSAKAGTLAWAPVNSNHGFLSTLLIFRPRPVPPQGSEGEPTVEEAPKSVALYKSPTGWKTARSRCKMLPPLPGAGPAKEAVFKRNSKIKRHSQNYFSPKNLSKSMPIIILNS